MHFLHGLFFLLLIMGLTFVYIAIPYVLFVYLKRTIFFLLFEDHPGKERLVKPVFSQYISKKALLGFLVIFLSFHISIYISNRNTWMGKDNAHFEAKEYYVSGQVLHALTRVMTTFLHPENRLLRPFYALQQRIYDEGIKYLPENDGEIGIWTDLWFVCPYSRKFSLPKGTNDWDYSPQMVRILEKAWFSIETAATKPFADKRMKEHHYYRNFPGMVLYYSQWKDFYAGRFSGAGSFLGKERTHVERTKRLIEWIEDLKEKWVKSEKIKIFLNEHPKVEVMLQVAYIMELGDVIRSRIYEKKFSCKDPFLLKYIQARQDLVGSDKNISAYRRMKDRNQAKRIHDLAIDSWPGRFSRYIIQKYCNVKVAGREDYSFYTAFPKGPGMVEEIILDCYGEEIKLIEEMNNE